MKCFLDKYFFCFFMKNQSPFKGENEDEIFEAILKEEVLYPVSMAKEAVMLLQQVFLYCFQLFSVVD